MHHFRIFYFILILFLVSCSGQRALRHTPRFAEPPEVDKYNLIPEPRELTVGAGYFRLSDSIAWQADSVAVGCAMYMKQYFAKNATFYRSEDAGIRFIVNHALPKEGYRLSVSRTDVLIEAADECGFFHAVQTIIQLTDDPRFILQKESARFIPALVIEDAPAMAYRGFMLDVTRHFYSVDFIKKLLNQMAYYKLNNFHWHLTDSEGWRIELKSHPELTRRSAWRTIENWYQWRATRRKFTTIEDKSKYGGYYTQEEIREVVAYADSLHINVIPEIEMPGHAMAMIHANPRISCKGYGSVLCVGKEETLKYVEEILTEVMTLFPSKYIHIGGDEVSYTYWEECPYCQQLIRREHLRNTRALHHYFIGQIAEFFAGNGRILVGWDEIAANSPIRNATVMAWQNIAKGIEVLEKGYPVIMVPQSHCYFDFYQSALPNEPKAPGAFTSYLDTYDFLPDSLRHQVYGIQGNLWTEHIATEEHAEYMIFPRLQALAETAWSENRNRNDFKRRLAAHLQMPGFRNVNSYHPRGYVEIKTRPDTIRRAMITTLTSEKYGCPIYYTVDGTMPRLVDSLRYTGSFPVSDYAEVKAMVFTDSVSVVNTAYINYHKALNCPVRYVQKYVNAYPANGMKSLTDGVVGGRSFRDGRWQGFMSDIDVIIDLRRRMDISEISMRFLCESAQGIHFPTNMSVSVSDNGKLFTPIGAVRNKRRGKESITAFERLSVRSKTAGRYIRVKVNNPGGFLFTDEIAVR